jgi:hypothetical protein
MAGLECKGISIEHPQVVVHVIDRLFRSTLKTSAPMPPSWPFSVHGSQS